MRGFIALCAYIATIFVANWLLVRYGIVPVGFGLYAPAGVFAAGVAFVLRDLVQESLGIRWVLAGIILGAILSGAVSTRFGVASGVAFLVSEGADFAVYTPLRRRSWFAAAVLSNTVGDLVDSLLFLWLAFGSLANVLGLIVGKWYATIPVVLLFAVRQMRSEHEAVAA